MYDDELVKTQTTKATPNGFSRKEASIKPKSKVLISYSHEDCAMANDAVTFLRKLDVEVKIDRELLKAPDPIGETLRTQIQDCDGCVLLLTENSVNNRWCNVEAGAFWGAGKPVIIFNPTGIECRGPFLDIKQARTLEEIERAVKGLELQAKPFATITVQEAIKIIEASVNSSIGVWSNDLAQVRDHLPAINRLVKYVEVQNNFLPHHAAVLTKITDIVKRTPKKLMFAFDVPSFGSISAENEYRECCDALDIYTSKKEWDLTILLLPADVGSNIVKTEFTDLQCQLKAWVEDIQALRRFQIYAQKAGQHGHRKFEIRWLCVNRDANGTPSCLHSMPLNVWVMNDEEAVSSTVIDSYHPTSTNTVGAGSQVGEIGFSTRNPDMVRFLSEIVEKYANNIDETMTLESQIAASEEMKSRLERLLSVQDNGSDR